MRYPTYPETIERIYAVHDSLLPAAEGMLAWLMSREEKKQPDYYAFARDGELLYDALWGIAQAGENKLSKRVHYLKTSVGMTRREAVHPEYFESIGISKSRIKNGPKAVFLDSGFQGSLFRAVSEWVGCEEDAVPNKNISGYLVDSHSVEFNQLSPIGYHPGNEIKRAMQNSPYAKEASSNLNSSLCAFMQLMPKFTGRYVQTFQRENGEWDVMPERIPSAPKLGKKSNESCAEPQRGWGQYQNSSIEETCGWINSDIIDPVASLLLQKRTLDYFTDPNVHDRIYSKLK